MATGSDNFVDKILSEGELCLHKKDKTLYVGLWDGEVYRSIRYDTLHTSTKIKSISSKELELTAPEKIDDICPKVLKPFFKTTTIPASMNWIKCIEKFISIEKLFMFVLTSKSKDYSPFMEFCGNNLDCIAWDTTDGDGNTMIHYATIMNSYPQVACEIIGYVATLNKYQHLIHETNNGGVVPLAFILNSKLRHSNTSGDSIVSTTILTRLIESGGSLLRKVEDGTFKWKGGNDIFFGTFITKHEYSGILVSTVFFKGEADGKVYRICCSLDNNPKCYIVYSDNFNSLSKQLEPTQIMQVLQFPSHQMVKKLFPTFSKFNSLLPDGSKVIHFIAGHKSTPVFEYVVGQFIKSNQNWLEIGSCENTILHSAILGDNSGNTKYIIDKCPEVVFKTMWNHENSPQKLTPLDLMLQRNMLELLGLVFKQYNDLITSLNNSGNSLFHIAVEEQNEELLRFLIINASRFPIENSLAIGMINKGNSQEKSPLMLCVEKKFIKGIEILLNVVNCDTGISANHGCNLLHIAIISYECTCFSRILSTIPPIVPNSINQSICLPLVPSETAKSLTKYIGLTPLLLSMTLHNLDAARLLIEEGAEINHSDPQNQTFFHFLMQDCRDKDKLENFFKIKLKPKNSKTTPIPFCPDLSQNEKLLYLSIELNNIVAFELLLPRSTVSMLAYQDSDSLNNVLHLALSLKTDYPFYKEILKRFKFLKEHGLESEIINLINKRNKKGQTPLLLSVQKGDVDSVQCLLEFGCDVTEKYEQGTANILHYAVVQANTQIVKKIMLKIDRKSEFVSKRNWSKLTPLHLAIKEQKLDTLIFLLTLDIDMEQQDIIEDVSLINYAIKHGKSIFDLVFNKIKSNKKVLSESFLQLSPEHPIHYAITVKNLLALQTLQLHDSSFLDLKTKDGLPLLHLAIREKFDDGAKFLIKKGHKLAHMTDQSQISILSSVHRGKLEFTENRIGYKLTSGYVLSNIPELDSTEYQEKLTFCKDFKNLLVNIVSCRVIEPIQCYLVRPLRPIYSKELSLIASEHGTLAVITFLSNGTCTFKFDLTAKTNAQNTVVHMGVYNPCEGAFNLLLNQVKQSEKTIFSVFSEKLINKRNREGQSALDLTIFENRQNSFNILIKHGASLGTDNDTTILHFYLECKNPDNYFLDKILSLFSQQSTNHYLNFKDKNGYTPLHLTIQTGNKIAYEKILNDKTCKFDTTTKEGNNILHLAIKKKDPELFKQIIQDLRRLEETIDPSKKLMNKPNNDGKSPKLYALDEGNIELFLNEPDIGIEGVGENGSSLLHYAVRIEDAQGKQKDMMKVIISKGEHLLNARDSNKQTPLHYAVIHARLTALEFLLQNSGLDLTCQDHLNNSALHYAAEYQMSESCLSALINHVRTHCPAKLMKFLNLQNSLTHTPLYSAIQGRNVKGIKILMEAGAKLPICQKDGPITLCNIKPPFNIKIPLCLYKVEMKDKSVPGFCVGFEVVKFSNWIVSDLPNLRETYFVEKTYRDKVIDVKDVTEDDLKRFILPCHSYDPLDLIISNIITEKFQKGVSLFHLAAANGSLEVVTFLSERKEFSYLERDNLAFSLHHYAMGNINEEIMQYLCQQTKKLHPKEFKELSGILLHFAIEQNYFEAFQILLQKSLNSDLTYVDQHANTLLHLIVNNGRNVSFTEALLASSQLNAPRYCNRTNANVKTALHLAIADKQLGNVEEILKHKPDISIQDSEGNTALHIAVEHSCVKMIEIIIQHISTLPDKHRLINASNGLKPSNKPIHLATLRGLPAVIELLLESNAELYGVNGEGETILHLAVQLDQSKRVTMVEKIFSFEDRYSNSEGKFIYRKDNQGNTPLHTAVSLMHDDVVTLLLTHQIDFTLENNDGQTVLHSSIETQSDSIFELILNVYKQHSIIKCDHNSQRLLCSQDKKGRTGLHYSIELQYSHAVDSLLSNSVCIDSRDKQGMTVLHYAAKFHQDLKGNIICQIISHILGIEVEHLDHKNQMVSILIAPDNKGRSPLMLSIEFTNSGAIDAILKCNPDFLSFDKEGCSVLHYAADLQDKSEQILATLITAIKQSNLGEVEFLNLVNLLNVDCLTALHLAISSSNIDSAKCLVDEGGKLVLPKDKEADNSVQTIGMDGLSKKGIELNVGVFEIQHFSNSQLEQSCEHLVWYMIGSTLIYSTLPRLDDVNFSDNKIDFKESNQQIVVSSVLESICTDILKSLLQQGRINEEDKIEDLTLLELAGEHATLSMMQFLCENYKFHFETRDMSGRTVIHHLIYNPSICVVDYLLRKVEDSENNVCEEELLSRIIDLTDISDCSPLKLCTKEKKWDNFIVLIEHGADFTQKDANGNTILHLMIINNANDHKSASKCLECLLNAFTQSNLNQKKRLAMLNATNKTGLTALHLAITKCSTTAAVQLINAGADLTNLHPSDGYTVVHTCVHNAETPSNLMLLNALCKAVKAYDNTQYDRYKIMHSKDLTGNTSLHLAIKMNRSAKVMELLLSNNAPFAVGNFLGNTPLHLSAMKDLLSHVKTILFFIQKDARDRGYGLSYRRERCIKEIMRKNKKQEMPILLTKDKDILLCMLNFWNDEVMLPLDPYRSGHLIHFAVYNQQRELFEAIVESQHSSRNEKLTSRDSEGMSPLHIAAEKNDFEIGKILISKGVDVNINSQRGTPIEVSIKSENIEFATKLIDEGADIKGYIFLLANDRISEKSVTRILDDKLLRISDIYSTAYCSVIHYAARQSSIARIKFLLGKNADFCARDRDGRRALHHAISSRRELTVLTAILDEAYRIDIKNPEAPTLEALLSCDYNGLTPGMLAAQLNYVEFFQMICTEKYKFHLDSFHYTDRHGDNLVHLMIKCTSMRCIRFLLPYLALNYQEGFSFIMNGRNVLGSSPIALARGKGQLETVNMIVELCDVEFFEFCPDVVHRITDEEDNNTLISILDKMIICDAKKAVMSTKILDSNEEGDYPDFGIFNYSLSPLWHKMYTSRTNRTKYHPLLKFAVDAKIRLYKWWYSLMLLLYLLFYIPMVAALLIASHHCDESLFYYQSPLDILRLLLEIYIIILTLLHMLNESIEVIGKWEYLKNLPSVSRKLAYRHPDSVKYYGLENLEGYLFRGVLNVFVEFPQKIYYLLYKFDRNYSDHLLRAVYEHITSSYSILEMASVIFLLQLFASRVILYHLQTPEASQVHWTLAALTFIFYTFKFFKYTKIFPTLGIYIETIFKVLKKDVPRFMLIIFLILIGYAGGAHLISRRFNQRGLSNPSDGQCSANLWLSNDFDSVYSILTPLLSGLLFLFGGGPSNFELEIYQVHIIFSLFYLIFAFGIIVVLLNIFIAQLSQTYSDVNSDKDIIDYKAELALKYEQHSNIAFILKWFFSKALRRIMVETVSVPIEEWNGYLKFYSERLEKDSNIVYQDLKQNKNYVEEIKSKENARLKAEIKNLREAILELNEANLDLKQSKKREETMSTQLTKLQEMISQLQPNPLQTSGVNPTNGVKRTD